MHALRANCGSYLYENLQQHWLTDEERRVMQEKGSAGVQSLARGLSSDPDGRHEHETDREKKKLPPQWPLFASPTLTTIRVTSYKDIGDTIVSWELLKLCILHFWGNMCINLLWYFFAIYILFVAVCITQYFVVQPTLEGFHWMVDRTYEEFTQLHRVVRDDLISMFVNLQLKCLCVAINYTYYVYRQFTLPTQWLVVRWSDISDP